MVKNKSLIVLLGAGISFMEKIYKKKSLAIALVLSLGFAGTISPQQKAYDVFDNTFKSVLNIIGIVAGGCLIVDGGCDVNNAMCDAFRIGAGGSDYLPLRDQPTIGVIKCAVGLAFAALNGDYLLRRITRPEAPVVSVIIDPSLKSLIKKENQQQGGKKLSEEIPTSH